MKYRQFSPQGRRPGGRVFNNRRPRRPNFKGSSINPQRFINKASVPEEGRAFTPKNTFADFGLLPTLYSNLVARGYVTPTRIQDAAIPHVLKGLDLVGLANTGTGKTGAFVIPMIQLLRQAQTRKTALVIAPTRELAFQIDEEFKMFGRGLGIYTALCVGGTSIYWQKVALSRRPHVVIGTPGRLMDLVHQGVLTFENTSILVLDEVDRMLDMGFIRDIRFLVSKLPVKRQSLCWSATLSPEIGQLLSRMLYNPVSISVRTSETNEHVEQNIIKASSHEEKIKRLNSLLREPAFDKVLIFGQTKWGVQKLADSLTRLGLKVQAIHGNKSQPQRQRALRAFKEGWIKILVATDVAARGLDIPNVSHVINFDQPATYDGYIHRIGRTGRMGKLGYALTFVP